MKDFWYRAYIITIGLCSAIYIVSVFYIACGYDQNIEDEAVTRVETDIFENAFKSENV